MYGNQVAFFLIPRRRSNRITDAILNPCIMLTYDKAVTFYALHVALKLLVSGRLCIRAVLSICILSGFLRRPVLRSVFCVCARFLRHIILEIFFVFPVRAVRPAVFAGFVLQLFHVPR